MPQTCCPLDNPVCRLHKRFSNAFNWLSSFCLRRWQWKWLWMWQWDLVAARAAAAGLEACLVFGIGCQVSSSAACRIMCKIWWSRQVKLASSRRELCLMRPGLAAGFTPLPLYIFLPLSLLRPTSCPITLGCHISFDWVLHGQVAFCCFRRRRRLPYKFTPTCCKMIAFVYVCVSVCPASCPAR